MRRLLLLALPFALMACGSDNNTTTGVSLAALAGTWNLQTANGVALPFTISNTGGAETDLLSVVEVVQANGSFTGSEVVKITINGVAAVDTLGSSGTISLSGSLVTVTLANAGTGSGTLISSTSFSFKDPTTGATFVFVKTG